MSQTPEWPICAGAVALKMAEIRHAESAISH
jgi:hypothetical protein